MKLRITKKGIAKGGFRISADEIELQVITDLSKYRRIYSEKYGKIPVLPLDVESFVKELWGVEVRYETINQTQGEETLGYFIPNTKVLVVDPEACGNSKRLSFTVGHEAGHMSLHSFLFKNDQDSGKKHQNDIHIERQAETYAAHLLAPKHDVIEFLQNEGYMADYMVHSNIDMEELAPKLQKKFGLSRHASEIHLLKMKVPIKNSRYIR